MSHKEQSGWVASTSQYTVTNTGGGGLRYGNVKEMLSS